MRAVVYAGPDRVARRRRARTAVAEPGDAVVRVTTGAICGTDLHLICRARRGIDARAPCSATSSWARWSPPGPAVTTVPAGRPGAGRRLHRLRALLVVPAGRPLGVRRAALLRDRHRLREDAGRCPGRVRPGAAFADVVLCPLPDGCTPDAAVFVGDTLATGYAAVERAGVATGRHRGRDRAAERWARWPASPARRSARRRWSSSTWWPSPARLAAAQGALAATPEDAAAARRRRLTDGPGRRRGRRRRRRGPAARRRPATWSAPAARWCRSAPISMRRSHFPVGRAFAEEFTLPFAIGDAIRLRDRLLPLVATGVIDPTVVVTERVALEDVPGGLPALRPPRGRQGVDQPVAPRHRYLSPRQKGRAMAMHEPLVSSPAEIRSTSVRVALPGPSLESGNAAASPRSRLAAPGHAAGPRGRAHRRRPAPGRPRPAPRKPPSPSPPGQLLAGARPAPRPAATSAAGCTSSARSREWQGAHPGPQSLGVTFVVLRPGELGPRPPVVLDPELGDGALPSSWPPRPASSSSPTPSASRRCKKSWPSSPPSRTWPSRSSRSARSTRSSCRSPARPWPCSSPTCRVSSSSRATNLSCAACMGHRSVQTARLRMKAGPGRGRPGPRNR